MPIVSAIQKNVTASLSALFNQSFSEKDFQVNQTKPEFDGDYTVVLFSLVKSLKLSPDAIGNRLGQKLLGSYPQLFTKFNIIKGFLNLTINDNFWTGLLQKNYDNSAYGRKEMNGRKVMVEYSSPNTNKPLHLGHLRNNFLGWSVAEILKANGYEVIKSCIVNDRGIHICKSMIAWQLFANGATPQSTNTKGDHFVGEYYVKFNKIQKNQIKAIGFIAYEFYKKKKNTNYRSDDLLLFSQSLCYAKICIENLFNRILTGQIPKHSNYHFLIYTRRYVELSKLSEEQYPFIESNEVLNFSKDILEEALGKVKTSDKFLILANYFENETPIMKAAQQMLLDWEQSKPEVMNLWRAMNSWVYAGFDITYNKIGVDFDKMYYESDTYLLGKDIVQQGLDKGVFFQKEDGSTWIDLTKEGLDEKIVRRKDGTSVYITQDIGLALQKYEQYKIDQSIYVIGNEQIYHMKVLQLICKKLGMPNADNIFHLSYGMVELTTGKMKSREGTVVDADELIDEMIATSQKLTEELGKVKDFTAEELRDLSDIIGLGAMKFYLLRVDPKKTMVFNPEESIDIHGFSAPFIQYTYARIMSILRKESVNGERSNLKGNDVEESSNLLKLEKEMIIGLEQYPAVLEQAGEEHNPSVIVNYVFNLAKTFNSFYDKHSIKKAETDEKKQLRLQIAGMTANTIKSGMQLMGIRVPERM